MDRASAVEVVLVGAEDPELLDQVMRLGDQYRDRLGHLPWSAYDEAAEQGRILAACPPGERKVLGYALFRLPRDEVVLTHLCVGSDERGAGIAKMLVDEISERYKDRIGIRAKCRDDYGLAGTWRALGFMDRAAKAVGRGADKAPMTVWWRDHGHPDLFTVYEQPAPVRAVVDLDVLRILLDPSSHEFRYLLADDLAERIELIVTSDIRTEIEKEFTREKVLLLDAFGGCPELGVNADTFSRLDDAIRSALLEKGNYPRTRQEEWDLARVVHAAGTGVPVFLTSNDNLVSNLSSVVEEIAGMRVIPPEYVFKHLDELANAASFQTESLADTEFTTARAGTRIESEAAAISALLSGESERRFRERIRYHVKQDHDIDIVRAPEGAMLAVFVVLESPELIEVPLLRVNDHSLTDTLARHLLWRLRIRAREQGAIAVKITDEHLSRRLDQAMSYESFVSRENSWVAPVVDVCGTAVEVEQAAAKSFRVADMGKPNSLPALLSSHAASRLEHAWWPAKVIDSELPCFIAPIRTDYSAELFGYPPVLPPRNSWLSLGREHVYFRSTKNNVLRAPARIVWYSSGDQTGARHFFATSRLEELVIDTPDRLHDKFSYYGVFNRVQVVEAARGNPKALAMRFADTELFDHPVPLRQYKRLAKQYPGAPENFRSARAIDAEMYAALYKAGFAT
ncbi:hypothetical protein SAMN04487819_108275 [Actinopolyspora alba]|uniref:N-acetyltransferase domain-containing protein n=1 Tax=Actinopolyspora alba TaxID=673379 RepID=A0A1I1Y9Q4_9ACTN|nr:GNAT family N-acetyltransferase [Actinopolyspora alba]SFE16294.1 hypothetical protein SAMN04487819_108275 [Actinopolyspora alba]